MNALLTLLAAAALAAGPQLPDSIDTQDSVRLNPDIVFDAPPSDAAPVPAFIRRGANHIILNGADWSPVVAKVSPGSESPLTFVHIGDSHVQAEIGTGVVRDMLQLRWGNAGRGLIAPLRLAGTNQPHDYSFESPDRWTAEKVMRPPWSHPMGFNGSSLTLAGHKGEITVSTMQSDDDYNPFSSITLFHSGEIDVRSVIGDMGQNMTFNVLTPAAGTTVINLWGTTASARVCFTAPGAMTLFGAVLSGQRPGVFYHAIGNNGATYSTYNRIGSTASGVAALHPDVIVISLGTNEAFGRLDVAEFRRSVDSFVRSIRRACPEARLLLVTPMECDRRVRSRRGRRSRASYVTNANILPLRNELLRYGREHCIAAYDWYDVAGGAGASARWLAAGLLARDRVHHTASGYRLQGRLLAEALQALISGGADGDNVASEP